MGQVQGTMNSSAGRKMNRREQEEDLLKRYLCPEQDDLETVGVLLSDEIEYYVKKYKMIDPFKHDNLKPANYELTVGNKYAIGGKIKELCDKPGKNEMRIPPFEVVVIEPNERINLPRFIVARWNIRVKWAYEGLLWVGGPQVDPGWEGHLSCPIYNLSDKEVTLRLGDPIAVMDFVKTTPFKKGVSKEYHRPPKRVLFDEYEPEKLISALYTEARKRVDDIEDTLKQFRERAEKDMKSFGSRLDISITTIFTCIAFLFAALVIFVAPTEDIPSYPSKWWIYVGVFISIIALSVAIHANAKNRLKYNIAPVDVEERIKRLECFNKLATIAMVALAIVIILIILGKI